MNYNPTMNSTSKEDFKIWKGIIAIIDAERQKDPTNPQLIDMLKLLRAHSGWFSQ